MNPEHKELYEQFKIELLRELLREMSGDARLWPLTDTIRRVLSKAEIQRGFKAANKSS